MARWGWLVIALGIGPGPVVAQRWNDAGALALVDRAIGGRTLADSSLHSYAARAHGIVTFSTEMISGAPLGPRVSKGDELVVEVYWERPDRSKQSIVAWRDSTFFPTSLAYHRDHLALVSDDAGATIRIGDGDEIADLDHPLSTAGRTFYDFRVLDTVRIDTGSGPLALVRLEVRPRDPSAPRVVGTLLLDLERAEVVRSVLSFTAAAYRDPTLEDIVVRLERSLVDGRHWLPFRQAIEIRRRSAVFDFPLRTVIRGRWEVDDYRLNVAMPAIARDGPAVGGLLSRGGLAQPGSLVDAIDSSLVAVGTGELETARAALVAAWRGRILDGLPDVRLAAERVSDLVRFNRVEGLRLGAGVTFGRAGPFDRIGVAAGYGFGDSRLTGGVELARRLGGTEVTLVASRGVEDAGDHPGASGVVNSLAAQEGGRDLGDYVLVDRLALGVSRTAASGWRYEGTLAREWSGSVAATAAAVHGRFRANPALGGVPAWVVALRGRRRVETLAGTSWSGSVAVEAGDVAGGYGRIWGSVEVGRPWIGAGWWRLHLAAGTGAGAVPTRRQFAWGGPGTVTGTGFRQFSGRAVAWGVLEAQWPIPGPSIGIGRWGRVDGTIRAGPYLASGWAGGRVAGPQIGVPSDGAQPVAGLAAEFLGRLVRMEIGQCLRCGLGPRFAIDVRRAFWPVL